MNRRAFTLIELLISLTIGMLLLGTLYWTLGAGLRQFQKIAKQVEYLQIANMVMERISKDIRGSYGILSLSTSTQLKLNYEKDIISYDLVNQKVRRKKNNSSDYLTDAGEVKALSFGYPADKMVEIKLDNFKSKVLVRN